MRIPGAGRSTVRGSWHQESPSHHPMSPPPISPSRQAKTSCTKLEKEEEGLEAEAGWNWIDRWRIPANQGGGKKTYVYSNTYCQEDKINKINHFYNCYDISIKCSSPGSFFSKKTEWLQHYCYKWPNVTFILKLIPIFFPPINRKIGGFTGKIIT